MPSFRKRWCWPCHGHSLGCHQAADKQCQADPYDSLQAHESQTYRIRTHETCLDSPYRPGYPRRRSILRKGIANGPSVDATRVEYALTDLGRDLITPLRALYEWGSSHPERSQRSCDIGFTPDQRWRNVMSSETLPPLPPFTRETAIIKVKAAEDGWNSCDPHRVSKAYSPNSYWRNRAEFIEGRDKIVEFLTRKWNKELEYRLIKELWAFTENHIAVRFAYEWHDDSKNWFRSYGNENWDFDENGLMRRRFACINDLPIKESDRKYHWDRSGPRPADHPGLTDLGL